MTDVNKSRCQLVEVISSLREDIAEAIAEGDGKDVKFDVGEIEVELKASITRSDETDIGGKLSFTIFGIGGETGGSQKEQKASENAHVIKLKLEPKIKNLETGEYDDVTMSDLD